MEGLNESSTGPFHGRDARDLQHLLFETAGIIEDHLCYQSNRRGLGVRWTVLLGSPNSSLVKPNPVVAKSREVLRNL
jgi:hypothetical protein